MGRFGKGAPKRRLLGAGDAAHRVPSCACRWTADLRTCLPRAQTRNARAEQPMEWERGREGERGVGEAGRMEGAITCICGSLHDSCYRSERILRLAGGILSVAVEAPHNARRRLSRLHSSGWGRGGQGAEAVLPAEQLDRRPVGSGRGSCDQSKQNQSGAPPHSKQEPLFEPHPCSLSV